MVQGKDTSSNKLPQGAGVTMGKLKNITELENQNLVVCAWRLDTKISAEEYVDAIDKLKFLAKKEVFDDIKILLDYYLHKPILKKKFLLGKWQVDLNSIKL